MITIECVGVVGYYLAYLFLEVIDIVLYYIALYLNEDICLICKSPL
jgi:hypothetical protein